MQEERPSIKRTSMGSRRSNSSDRSLQCLIEDLSGRIPRYNDIVYVMSIESEGSRVSRVSDTFERRGQNSIRYSNEAVSMEVENNNLSRGSHGMLGRHQPKGDIQLYPEETMRTHECDCYQNCIGQNCACFMTLLMEPCEEGKCCEGCIRLKIERIQLAATEFNEEKTETRTVSQAQPVKSGCSCKKTRCLKLYCECFSKKGYCSQNCNCQDCLNMFDSEARNNAIVENSNVKEEQRGCNCKKTRCQKKYCACYGAGLKCTKLCQCQNCCNMNQELKTLRNFQLPTEEPFYPPMAPTTPVETLPTNIEFTSFQFPEFAKLSIS